MSTPQPFGALDHPEDDLLGQLGGVGRVAAFMARVTERGDEHDGGSLVAGASRLTPGRRPPQSGFNGALV